MRRARPLDASPGRPDHLYGGLRGGEGHGALRGFAGTRGREARRPAPPGALCMCLIVLGWQADERYRLRVAANRDECHGRRAAPAAFWRDHPGVLAGRDLEAMGTWMGVSRSGRFAAVTNYRGAREPSAEESRGALVSRFLANGASAASYIGDVSARASGYSGFNLLVCDREELWW